MIGKEKYEARYLLSLISSIINQTDLPHSVRNLEWKHIYKLADYHNVANVVYFGVLGLDEYIPEEIKKKFYEKYQDVLLAQDGYKKAEEMLIRVMEKFQIHAMLLKDSALSACYEQKEMHAMSSVGIITEKGREFEIDRLMKKMDYWSIENRGSKGRFYYKIPRTTVAFYTNYGFHTKVMKKYFDFSLKTVDYSQGKRYIHEFSEEEFYVYLISDLVYRYASSNIDISSMMDFWMYYKKYKDALDWIYIKKELEKLTIGDFSRRLLHLAHLWFGNEQEKLENENRYMSNAQKRRAMDSEDTEKSAEFSESINESPAEMDIYDAMESYILTKGVEGRVISSTLLPLIKEVADFYIRDRRQEWIQKRRRFMFPEKDYMERMYPRLEKSPKLLGLYWIYRLAGIWWQITKKGLKKRTDPITYKLKELIHNLFGKGKPSGGSQAEEFEESNQTANYTLFVAEDLKQRCPDLTLCVFNYSILVQESPPELTQVLDNTAEKLSEQYAMTEISSIPHIQSTRQAYQALGKSPHEYRNSAERLMRDIVAGNGVSHINNVTDINSLISISSGYCISSYDTSALYGAINLKLAAEREQYKEAAAEHEAFELEFLPTLYDRKGAFGTPTLDSSRGEVQMGMRSVMTVFYSFDGADGLKEWVKEYKFLLNQCCEATSLESYYI